MGWSLAEHGAVSFSLIYIGYLQSRTPKETDALQRYHFELVPPSAALEAPGTSEFLFNTN